LRPAAKTTAARRAAATGCDDMLAGVSTSAALPPHLRTLVAMLRGDAPERQIAAAIVLGELGARDAAVVDALGGLRDGAAALQRHALAALGRVGAKKALPRMLPLLGARDEAERAAAVAAVAAFGEDAVPAVRQRLDAAAGDERRALEEVLGRTGGRES